MKLSTLSVFSLLCLLPTAAYSQNSFPTSGDVGIGTSTPNVQLHIKDSVGNSSSGVLLEYENLQQNSNVTGIKIEATPTTKGVQTALTGNSEGQHSNNRGKSYSSLASSSTWSASGRYTGVTGRGHANKLTNMAGTGVSQALGGHFTGGAPVGETLTLFTNNGTYYAGGVFGELTGTINNVPTNEDFGVSSGIIGVDSSDGNATSYAGYFAGNLAVRDTDNPNLSIGRPTSNMTLGVATCNGCYNSFAKLGDPVIRVLGDAENLILSTSTTSNSGRSIIIASESDRLGVFSDSGDICLGAGC